MEGHDKVRLTANTIIIHDTLAELLYIRLHSTDILTISPLNNYQFFTGGWTTHTTKKRLNQLSPLIIIQKNYEWFYEDWTQVDGVLCPFKEGMILNINGHKKDDLWSI